MARGPLHERSLLEQWMHFIFAPRHVLLKAGILGAVVFLFLSPFWQQQVIQYVVTIAVVILGFAMIFGAIKPKKTKKKGDH